MGQLALLLPLPLFSRLDRSAALDNPRRRLILTLVEREPGVRFHELKRELELPHGVLVHHLRVLRRQGLLVFERDGRRLRLRLPGQRLPEDLAADPAALLARVESTPGLNLRELADALGWTRRKAVYWSRFLEQAGRLRAERAGPGLRLHVLRPEEAVRVTAVR